MASRIAGDEDSKIVHIYDADQPHILEFSDDKPCWCEPGILDCRAAGGGVVVVHTKVTFH